MIEVPEETVDVIADGRDGGNHEPARAPDRDVAAQEPSALKHRRVEFLPVVEVVQVDGVVADGGFVGDAAGAEDALAGAVVVNVAGDGGIQFRDGGWIFGAWFAS